MRHHSFWPVWFQIFSANVFILFLFGCQTSSEDEIRTSESRSSEDGKSVLLREEYDVEKVESVTMGLSEILEETLGDPPYTPAIRYQELQELLPERINGVRPAVTEGHTLSIGSGFSKVSGEYRDEDQVVTVTIIDLAAFGTLAAKALSDWVDEDIDRKSDRGFERTNIFRNRSKEYPTYEKYYSKHGRESCELHSWVEDRFMIAISGDSVPMSICESARDKISFKKLERLAESVVD